MGFKAAEVASFVVLLLLVILVSCAVHSLFCGQIPDNKVPELAGKYLFAYAEFGENGV